jgi:GAF domain-containing protein
VKMTSTQAGSVKDTPELVANFSKAFGSVRNEFKAVKAQAPQTGQVTQSLGDVRNLRRHIEIYLDLMTHRTQVLSNTADTARRVNEAAADALDCERVSVWWLDDSGTKITCADLFEKAQSKHSSGVELFSKDFPPYFEALKTERTIAAHDAHTDPRTSCFSAVYLKPLGINSMLDVPIWFGGKMIGVICHEHVGPPRLWNADEEKFGYLMSSFIALSKERGSR